MISYSRQTHGVPFSVEIGTELENKFVQLASTFDWLNEILCLNKVMYICTRENEVYLMVS